MARLINVEKSQYLTQNIESYAKTKVGQYSKFLEKNPLFITWLSVNRVKTRSDVGTGGVESEVGNKSPVRYNQIDGLPTYNIPDLRPDVEYDEQGYDINIDITDAILLPNTIKPQVGDYLIIKLPSSVEVAFRVNAFGYNTIQSNDFYTYSADLKFTGRNLIERFRGQIDPTDVFDTIFDNIGTEDKCLIRRVDIDKIKNVGLLFQELRDIYKENYFDKTTGCFVSTSNEDAMEGEEEFWLYDAYLSKFIMDTGLYFSEINNSESIVLAPADIDENVSKYYVRTLYYAVQKKDTAYLCRFPWFYQAAIQKRLSTFRIHHINCNSVRFHPTEYPLLLKHSDGLDSEALKEYFPHGLIHGILDDDGFEDTVEHKYDPHLCWDEVEDLDKQEELNPIEGEEDDDTEDGGGDSASSDNESQGKILHLINYIENTDYEMNYEEEIIYNYMLDKPLTIDRRKLVRFALQINNYTYRMMPILMYIILEYYNSYFKKENTDEL